MNQLYPAPEGCTWTEPTEEPPFPIYELRRSNELLGTVSQPMDNWVAMIGDSVLDSPGSDTGVLWDVSRALVVKCTELFGI